MKNAIPIPMLFTASRSWQRCRLRRLRAKRRRWRTRNILCACMCWRSTTPTGRAAAAAMVFRFGFPLWSGMQAGRRGSRRSLRRRFALPWRDDDVSGGGRADLVTPPANTQARSSTCEGCSRVRVLPGFQGPPARWKSQASWKCSFLLTASTWVPEPRRRPMHVHRDRARFRVTPHVQRIDAEDFAGKPTPACLHCLFLSGGSETHTLAGLTT